MATLLDADSGAELCGAVSAARAPWTRIIGYLLRGAVSADEGLWFAQCGAIHTFGMRAAIDVFFLDRNGRILAIEAPAQKGRAFRVAGASTVLECGAGFAASRKLSIGRRVELVR